MKTLSFHDRGYEYQIIQYSDNELKISKKSEKGIHEIKFSSAAAEKLKDFLNDIF